MKRIHRLDFMHTQPTPWFGWAAVGIGLLALAAFAVPLWPLAQDNQARQDELRQATRRATEEAVTPPLTPVDRRKQVQAKRLLVQLEAPWNELFALLEQHADPQVGLLRLEPDAATGQFRLMALCKDLQVMAAWLRRLEQDPRLSEVQIQQHQIEDLTPGRPVRFSVVARWRNGSASGATATSARPGGPATTPMNEAQLTSTGGVQR